MRQSEQVNELAKALAAAQGDADNVAKTAKNEAFKRDGKASTYATLADALEAIREPFKKNGLSVVQATVFDAESQKVLLTTRLLHVSGQWLEGDYPVIPTNQTPQAFGSAMTYARRHTLMAIAGIAPEDDDGNAASTAGVNQVTPVRPVAPPPLKENDASFTADELTTWSMSIQQALEGAASVTALDKIMEESKQKLNGMKTLVPETFSATVAVATKRKQQLMSKQKEA